MMRSDVAIAIALIGAMTALGGCVSKKAHGKALADLNAQNLSTCEDRLKAVRYAAEERAAVYAREIMQRNRRLEMFKQVDANGELVPLKPKESAKPEIVIRKNKPKKKTK